MNKAKLKCCVRQRVRLHPVPWRMTPDGDWLPRLGDDWIVTGVDHSGVTIGNIRTGHAPTLGFDQVHHYASDPLRDWNGLRHGFLDLNVQLTISGCNVFVDPIRPHRPDLPQS